MSSYINDMYSCEYIFSEEELDLIEMMSKQYDEILAIQAENPPQIGYCGFACDYECHTCYNVGSYDTANEY